MATWAGGNGKVNDPYLISTEAQLRQCGTENMIGFYALTNDIELTSPLGNTGGDYYLRGGLDGRGYMISGLEFDQTVNANRAGLFSHIYEGTIVQNLHIRMGAAGIKGESAVYKGALAGRCKEGCTFQNILIEGKIWTGGDRAGGLIGYVEVTDNTYNHCFFINIVAWVEQSGGLASSSRGGPIVGWAGSSSACSQRSGVFFDSALWTISHSGVGYGINTIDDIQDVYGNDNIHERWTFDQIVENDPSNSRLRFERYRPTTDVYQVTGVVSVNATLTEGIWVTALTAWNYQNTGQPMQRLASVQTAADGSYTLQWTGYYGPVIVVATPGKSNTVWAASTAYAAATQRIPTVENGFLYEVLAGGTSGATEPTWPTTPGDTVVDGTVTWECVEYHRPLIHGTLWPELVV